MSKGNSAAREIRDSLRKEKIGSTRLAGVTMVLGKPGPTPPLLDPEYREIPSALKALGERIDYTEKALAKLGQRLSPILRTSIAPETALPAPMAACDLGSRLFDLSSQLGNVVTGIENLLERIEL
jgi:hypothetical protein